MFGLAGGSEFNMLRRGVQAASSGNLCRKNIMNGYYQWFVVAAGTILPCCARG